ncbi:MAG: glucosidase [Acidobacteriia bacterium]|nr:glucosidase [Terriglobia bacterium]
MSAEHDRLEGPYTGLVRPWRKWGPYLSDRSWGTVREDYSPHGTAWDFLPHDYARSKAYRWGEDGIAGICDRYQILCFALAFWNGRDPILKERLFGLQSSEGNHGEDVKEYYFYLDSTPTHSYMRMLYKYPQREFPYGQLVEENRRRNGTGMEYELLDTGIFDDDRYFDIVIEYAKAAPESIAIRVEIFNRGPEDADLHVLPHLWFRNTWAWTEPRSAEPVIRLDGDRIVADDRTAAAPKNLFMEYRLGERFLYGPPGATPLFSDNESNAERLYGASNRTPYVKDAFHRYLVHGEAGVVNPAMRGTKACLDYKVHVAARSSVVLRLSLTDGAAIEDVDAIVASRKSDADEFYATVHPPRASDEEKMIQRQALAGLLWSKQFYYFDVNRWLEGDNPNLPPPESRKHSRNRHWRHLNSMRLLSMPDKWEYPWFAAWDLAFQCISLALVDPGFAKDNLWFLLFEQFQHINGQIPAYEWEFSDLNPPVHAWACWRVYQMEGAKDRQFLEKCFHKLLINFAWWVNKVDSQGNNVFEGGFLGLDNITVVDRSEKLPNGAILEQSDGTGWMAFFCLYMMRIALELAKENKSYEGLATKFFEHFVYIGSAMKKMGGRDYQLWDDQDGFFYDILRYPNGEFHKFRVRSLVGLIPMFAIETVSADELRQHPDFMRDVNWFVNNRAELVGHACEIAPDGYTLSIVDRHQLGRILERLRDPNEFLSDAGIRSLSRFHRDNPFVFGHSRVRYEPAEEDIKLKGGNSNWRGPIWFPTSYLIVESLVRFGDRDLAQEVAERLIGIFKRDQHGRRPVFGGAEKFQTDPHWRDHLLFYEHFHGDNGAGIGASHQTGWTALVANLIDEWRR